MASDKNLEIHSVETGPKTNQVTTETAKLATFVANTESPSVTPVIADTPKTNEAVQELSKDVLPIVKLSEAEVASLGETLKSQGTEVLTDNLMALNEEETIQVVKAYPQIAESKTLVDVFSQSHDLETDMGLLHELAKRGNFDELITILKQLTPSEQLRCKVIVDLMKTRGIEFSLPDERYNYAENQFNAVSLNDMADVPDYHNQTGVSADSRKFVFHGTKQESVSTLQHGFYSVSPTYRVFTKDIHASLNYKSGMRLDKVSDGTVTLWNPDSQMLSDDDGTTFSIVNKLDGGEVMPDNIPRPKNAGMQKNEPYSQFIPPQYYVASFRINGQQSQYLDSINTQIANMRPEDIHDVNLGGFVSKLVSDFPGEIDLKLQNGHNVNQNEVVRASILFMYESRLQRLATACKSGNPDDIDSFRNFPTFGDTTLENYKQAKLVALDTLLVEKSELKKITA